MLIVIASVATLLLLLGFAKDFARLRLIPRLLAPAPGLDSVPLVSVLIPARNEARSIARCLDGALHQTFGRYEVIVVDDGSTDATSSILAHYAQEHTHLHVIDGAELPPGWTGKTYACYQAAAAAQGDWLLFLDADTVPQPDLLAALVTHTQHYALDMLTVFPFLELGSFWERVLLPPFQAIIRATFPFERINASDARPEEVVANGQCIFVKQSAYWSIGGHEAVHSAVLEDVRLAQALRAAGYRTGAVEGMRYLRVRMYTNGREVFEGLTKNAAAGYTSGGDRSFWVGTRQFFQAFAPLWLLFGGLALLLHFGDLPALAVFLFGLVVLLVALGLWSTLLRQLYALPAAYALLWPFALLCYGVIVLRSIWYVRSGRGVPWKGRNYVGT
jgi:glycosyltransferase involved in cell wall biosynthesis